MENVSLRVHTGQVQPIFLENGMFLATKSQRKSGKIEMKFVLNPVRAKTSYKLFVCYLWSLLSNALWPGNVLFEWALTENISQ